MPPADSSNAPAVAGPVRLPLPDAIVPGEIVWTYVIAIAGVHLLALLAILPWTAGFLFSWTGLISMLVGVHVFGWGINLCYHRLLAHKSATVPKWLERTFVVLALCCMQDTPGKWVATHRYHHHHSDESADPHSPLVAFLWAHVGWLLVRNRATQNVGTYRKFARDVLEDPFYLALELSTAWIWIYIGHALLFFGAGFGVGWFAGGSAASGLQFGLSLLVWGVFVRTVAVWHITWSVNSLTHLFGYANYETGDHSKNNWFVGLIAAGEGWHNNHHHDPASASNQHRWWEIDVIYYEILLLKAVGLATDVVPPKFRRDAARAARSQTRGAVDVASVPNAID
ncbi:MAG: fatty acid desaturase [Phycisphaerae bacterium]|nr:fatty acid desaturase [Phycisphaerae bacterium]